MLRCSDQPALHGIVVKVIHLLEHDLVIADGHGVEPLLPHLPLALGFMRGVKILELIQQPLAVLRLQLVHDALGRETFEIPHHLHEIGCR